MPSVSPWHWWSASAPVSCWHCSRWLPTLPIRFSSSSALFRRWPYYPLFSSFSEPVRRVTVAAIAFGAVWPILLNTLDGIRSIDPSIRLVARSYRIRTPLLVTQVLLPGAMPQITVGIRTSLAIGVVIMVGSEMYVSTAGIGHFVIVAQQTFAIADMWSGILLLGIIGYVLNLGYGVIERWLLRWQPRTHDALAVKGN